MEFDIQKEINELAPSISNILIASKSRYIVPKNYNQSLTNDLLAQSRWASPKETYQVPDEYFNELHQQILNQTSEPIETPTARIYKLLRSPLVIGMAASLIVLIGFFGLFSTGDQIEEDGLYTQEYIQYVSNNIDDLSIDDLSIYDLSLMDYSVIDEDELIDEELLDALIQNVDDDELYEIF